METLSGEWHTLKCRDANPNVASHCQIQKLVASCTAFEVWGCASMECIFVWNQMEAIQAQIAIMIYLQ